ncbi:MAG: putative two-component system response regulator [Paracoccaceae bacterium]|jgi:putative two-component system response regulator
MDALMENERPLHILLADDEHSTLDLLGTVLRAHGFQVHLSATPEDAIAAVEAEPFDAVVTDVVFDGRSAGEEILSATKKLRPRAICLLMTGYPRVDAAVQAMKIGAEDYLQKPVDPTVLAATIQRAVHEKRLGREELPFQDLVDILSGMVAKSIERVDPYTAGHGERTRRYCRLVAQDFGLDAKTVERLELAAIAHDYGKIFLDDLGFLTKKGALSPNERREMQRHPLVGAERLGAHPQLAEVVQFVAEHHERWDGLGYPFRLRGREISRPGRILCLVEVFDSLTTRRSYKNAWSLQKTMDYFESQAGRAFDPEILDTFLRLLEVNGNAWLEAPKADLAAAGLLVPAERGELPTPPRVPADGTVNGLLTQQG